MFNYDEAKNFLERRELFLREEKERMRQEVLEKAIFIIKNEIHWQQVEVYLVGSITRPFAFGKNSDIDIVVKNFSGDRFDLSSKLENKLGWNIDIILFENCSFQEHILQQGIRVI